MMKKKGMSDMFKYILVLFAGIIILIFFIRFAFQAKEAITKVTALDVIETLNDYFNALSSSGSLVTTAEINSHVVVNYPDCGYIGVEREKNKPLDTKEYSHIIFSPKELDKKIFVWVKEWKYPFRIANFFYLISPNTKVYLIGNSKLIDELIGIKKKNGQCCENSNYIDPRFMVEKRGSADPSFMREQAKKYNKVIFVFFGGQPVQSNLENVETRSITAQDCEDAKNDEDCRGIINFGDKQGFFVGRAMLYGAIFADDGKNYECGFKQAIKRQGYISEIYTKKKLMLQKLKNNCNKYGFNIKINTESMDAMHNDMKMLKDSNMELGGADCVKVF